MNRNQEKLEIFKRKYPNIKFNESNIRSRNFTDNKFNNFILKTGYACNQNCIHCFASDKRNTPKISLEELKSNIDDIDEKNTIVTLTGGEPTIRKDFIDILKYIKSKGYLTLLQSNGTKFSDNNYVKEIEPYLDMIYMPVFSNISEIHDAITSKKGSWEMMKQAFINLENSNIFIWSNTVINKLNYKTLLETADMIQEITPGNIMTFTFPHSLASAYSTKVTPMFSEIKEYLLPVLKRYGYLIHTHYLPRCVLYPYQNIVELVDDADGKIDKVGIDYIENTWSSVNYSDIAENARVKNKNCSICRYDDVCLGVWKEYVELYNILDVDPIL